MSKATEFEFPAFILKALVACLCSTRDDVRDYLNHVHWIAAERMLVASNGHVLYCVNLTGKWYEHMPVQNISFANLPDKVHGKADRVRIKFKGDVYSYTAISPSGKRLTDLHNLPYHVDAKLPDFNRVIPALDNYTNKLDNNPVGIDPNYLALVPYCFDSGVKLHVPEHNFRPFLITPISSRGDGCENEKLIIMPVRLP